MSEPPTYDDLVVAAAPALLRLALMLAGHPADAEDLLQATFLRATRHGRRISAMAAPTAYLRTIMLNEHASVGRRLSRRLRTVELTVEPAVPAHSVDHRDEAWRWLATLPPRQRAVLVLRYYEDLPDAEIAALLGCSAGTVRSNAFRALAALRARLGPEVASMHNRRLRPRTITDPQEVARLVAAANGLLASARPSPGEAALCPFAGDPPPSYALTFRSSAATVVYRWDAFCFGQVSVIRNGEPVGPTLDPGRLGAMVDRLAGR